MNSSLPTGLPQVLVLDLDGIIVGAPRHQLVTLARAVEARRINVIWATGRALSQVYPVWSMPTVPKPRYIIADVGATVVDGESLRPIETVQSEIEKRFPGRHKILQAFAHIANCTPQPVPQERRCSFYLPPEAFGDHLAQLAESLGCAATYSANQYLDVLPLGVSKGETLVRLLDAVGLSSSEILVIGDSMNDHSLFKVAHYGAIPSNAEPQLRRRLHGRPNIFSSTVEGSAAALEALQHFGWFEQPSLPPYGPQPAVVAYHRAPALDPEAPLVRNGVLTSLEAFFRSENFCWVGGTIEAPEPAKTSDHLEMVSLSPEVHKNFHTRMCRGIFWPILHSTPSQFSFDPESWAAFRNVNLKFAEKIATVTQQAAQVLINDFSLWLVPGFLRKLRPDLLIGFFHHTPFPASSIFNIIPSRREIIGSLLCSDLVGFQTPRDVEHFIDALRSFGPTRVTSVHPVAPKFKTYDCAIGIDAMPSAVEVDSNCIRIGAFPVGANISSLRSLAHEKRVLDAVSEAQQTKGIRKNILSIARLEHSKGILEQLDVFEDLLHQQPQLREEVFLTLVAVPSGGTGQRYEELKSRVLEKVNRINSTLNQNGQPPIMHFDRVLSLRELIPLYACADVAWITPLRDGLNLVAKEYIAARALLGIHEAALVLSEYAGAALELKGAILVNPYDANAMRNSLVEAIFMNDEQRQLQMKLMAPGVLENDLVTWAKTLVQALATTIPSHSATRTAGSHLHPFAPQKLTQGDP